MKISNVDAEIAAKIGYRATYIDGAWETMHPIARVERIAETRAAIEWYMMNRHAPREFAKSGAAVIWEPAIAPDGRHAVRAKIGCVRCTVWHSAATPLPWRSQVNNSPPMDHDSERSAKRSGVERMRLAWTDMDGLQDQAR